MGNRQSLDVSHETDHGAKNVQSAEANGHAISALDVADAVPSKTSAQQNSELPVVTLKVTTKSSPGPVERNGKQTSAPVAPPEVPAKEEIPAESSPPAEQEPPKTAEPDGFFNKIFKKKADSVPTVSESNGSAKEQITQVAVPDGQMSEIGLIRATRGENREDTDSVSLPSSFDHEADVMRAAEKLTLQLISSTKTLHSSEDLTLSTSSMQTSSATEDTEARLNMTCPEAPSPLNPASVAEEPVAVGEKTLPVVKETSPGVSAADKTELVIKIPASGAEDRRLLERDTMEPKVQIDKKFSRTRSETLVAMKSTPIGTELLNAANASNELVESWVLIDDPSPAAIDSSVSTQLLHQLKSACVKTVEDFSYKAVSVNVCAKERTVHIIMEVSLCTESEANRIPGTVAKSLTKEQEVSPKIPRDDHIRSIEPPSIKGSPQPEKEPKGESPKPSAVEVADNAQLEQTNPEENPVMNFFKTLVSPTKSTKDATATPDVSKDQAQKDTPSAPAANVQEAPKLPPPPPPAPPKMESKAEPAVKKEEAPAAEAAAQGSKETETPSKTKTKDSPFGKLFRPKSVVKEEAQPVEVQVDASKTSTLEVAAKPEPAPAAKAEEKKPEKKPSPFANLLKPKVLLGQVSSKIQAAASSAAASVALGARGAGAEAKKDAPAAPAPTTAAEAATSAKAKEEPKPAAAAAAAPAPAPDSKTVGSAENPSPSATRKLEKRNSIQLFFKNLGQKRHSDAGVQTEPVAPEKAK